MAYDVVVVGGGVVGLWVARHAIKAGMSVALVDKVTCSSGASGTVLGALLPHLPRVMSAKKIFQFEALAELPTQIDALEDDTGLDTGYARCGRIMPIRTQRYLDHAKAACIGSNVAWNTAGTNLAVEVRDTSSVEGWIDEAAAPLGIIHDNLSARIIAEKYTTALRAFVADHGTLLEGVEVMDIDTGTGRLNTTTKPLDLIAHDIVLAAGHETFPLAERILGLKLGGGVKGQAAVFEIEPQSALPPVIYDNGVYIVPHGLNRCAVGSTSEDEFDDPTTPDPAKSEAFITRAKILCPPLRNGRLIAHWAGVRPRCTAKDPIIGCLDPTRHIHIATGGYKITFGIAHRLAQRLVENISQAEDVTVIPETYSVEAHLENAAQRG